VFLRQSPLESNAETVSDVLFQLFDGRSIKNIVWRRFLRILSSVGGKPETTIDADFGQ
jgi:hypothetical protein